MFQFPGFALESLCIQLSSTCLTELKTARGQSTDRYQVGCPIRKFPDQRVLSPPRNLSQSATSFIASYRLGIHQTPFSRLIRSSRSKAVAATLIETFIFPDGPGCHPEGRRRRARSVSRLGKTATFKGSEASNVRFFTLSSRCQWKRRSAAVPIGPSSGPKRAKRI
jgi:hypothetical protein